MTINLSDNAAQAIIAICLLVAFLQMASCLRASSLADHDVEKAHIAAGECRNGWGTWAKCKSTGGQ